MTLFCLWFVRQKLFEFFANGVEKLKQKMNDWRHKFVEHSFLALRTFFEGHKDETIEQRKARVELQLENKNFVYRTLETSNEGMVSVIFTTLDM